MNGARLGSGGPAIGALGYGLWRFADHDVQAAERLIAAALDRGITLIDNADVYGFGGKRGFGGAEALLGELFARDPSLRGRMTLVTKGGVDLPTPYDAGQAYLVRACEASLQRLRTDAVDLYLVHRPDPTTHPAQTAAALDHIVSSGMAARVGVSNYSVGQARALAAHMTAPLVCHQVEVSAWDQSAMADGVLDHAMETNAAVLAWSPLAGGALATGTCPDGADPAAFARVIAALDEAAAAHGVDRTIAALAFVRGHGAACVPLLGTQNVERLEEAALAPDIVLTKAEWFAIVAARRGAKLP